MSLTGSQDKSGSQDNLVLIGMPGAGKSTVGVLLAKRLGFDFLDTDVLIQTLEGRTLQEIVDAEGAEQLRRIEERVLSGLKASHSVIATGGSAVYSAKAMSALGASGLIVNLYYSLSVIERRVNNHDTRGLVKAPGQSFSDLYQERIPLYQQYADITIDAADEAPDQVVERVIEAIGNHRGMR